MFTRAPMSISLSDRQLRLMSAHGVPLFRLAVRYGMMLGLIHGITTHGIMIRGIIAHIGIIATVHGIGRGVGAGVCLITPITIITIMVGGIRHHRTIVHIGHIRVQADACMPTMGIADMLEVLVAQVPGRQRRLADVLVAGEE